MMKPYPIGYSFGGSHVVEVLDEDDTNSEQPYLYRLANGKDVWIPVDGSGYLMETPITDSVREHEGDYLASVEELELAMREIHKLALNVGEHPDPMKFVLEITSRFIA